MEFDNYVKRIVDILNDGKDMKLLEKLVDGLIKSGVKIDFDCGLTRKYWHFPKFPKYSSTTLGWGECCVKIDFSEHDKEITEALVKENESMKRKIRLLEKENAEKYRIEELEELCKDLQDQHQQDCIRYNDIRTAFLKTVDELATLRKQFGVGQ